MAKLAFKVASTSKIVRLFIQDSSQTDGRGLSGLAYNTASLVAYYIKEGQATATAITLVTATVGTWTSGGFKEVDATNMPGVYELHLPDAALSTGKSVLVMLKGAANMVQTLLEIELEAVDNQDAAGYGLSRVDAAITSRLAPTVAARTLDVSSTGEAGVDWANVGSPTSAVDLNGTTIKTSQVVASVTGAVGSVTGAVGSVTGAVGSVTGAVGSVTGAVGSVTGNVGGNVNGSVGSIGTGGIAAAAFAAGAITAAAIAADAIGASELASDAVVEIQSGLATSSALATAQADLDDIQTRIPAALVSGRIDASVGAMAADVLTASALASSAVDEILDDTIGDGTITIRQAMRVILAGMAGKVSGAATTTITIRNLADTADVIVAIVDADGNRSTVTVTP